MPAGNVADAAAFYAEDTLVAPGPRTASGDSGILAGDFGPSSSLRLQLHVTAASGTAPTLDVVLEDTVDGTNFHPVAAFAQRSGVGRQVIDVTDPFARRLRVRWTIAGTTPSFTFSVVCASQTPQA